MRRFDLGDPIPLQQRVTAEDGVTLIETSGTFTLTKPDGTTYDGTVQSGGTGILNVTVPASEANQRGRYSYVWTLDTGAVGIVPGRFYVEQAEDELPPLASVDDLSRKLGYFPEESELDRAEHLLNEASELIRDKAEKTWVNASTGALESVPRRVRLICVAAAFRAFTNPEGLSQKSIGDSSKSYDRTEREGGEDVYLTEDETDTVRKAAGLSSLVSVTMTSTYSADYVDPWDAVTVE